MSNIDKFFENCPFLAYDYDYYGRVVNTEVTSNEYFCTSPLHKDYKEDWRCWCNMSQNYEKCEYYSKEQK